MRPPFFLNPYFKPFLSFLSNISASTFYPICVHLLPYMRPPFRYFYLICVHLKSQNIVYNIFKKKSKIYLKKLVFLEKYGKNNITKVIKSNV